MTTKVIGTAAAAKRHNVSERRIQLLIQQERIPGAQKIGGVWLLPEDFTITPPSRKHAPLKIKTA